MDEHAALDPVQLSGATGDMDPEAFRRYGHQVVDWMADYLAHVGTYPVLSQDSRGYSTVAAGSTASSARSYGSHSGRY